MREKKQGKLFGFLWGLSPRTSGVSSSPTGFCHHRPWDSGGRIVTSACPAVADSGDRRSVRQSHHLTLSLPASAAFLQRTDSRQPLCLCSGRLRGAVHDFTLRRPTAIHNVSRNQSHGEEKNTDIQDHGREEPAGDVYEAQVWPDEEGL